MNDEAPPKETLVAIQTESGTRKALLILRQTGKAALDSSDKPNGSKVFGWNLFALVVLGVLFCGWTIRYTDWFPIVGGLLTLSGALSWLAFVSKLLPEEEIKVLQTKFYNGFFGKPSALLLISLLLAAGILLSSRYGSVQIESLQQGPDRRVWVRASQSQTNLSWLQDEDFDRISPASAFHKVLRVGWRKHRFLVKVAGLPAREITLWPWHREELFLPNSFQRPVILLTPSKDLLDVVAQNPMILRVENGGRSSELSFDGHAVWIGCDEDVQVPLDVIDHWQRGPESGLINTWLPPRALKELRGPLDTTSNVQVTLKQTNDVTYTSINYPIKAPIPYGDFQPQVEVLDAPKNL